MGAISLEGAIHPLSPIRVTPLHSSYITPVGYDHFVDLLPQEQLRLLGQVFAVYEPFWAHGGRLSHVEGGGGVTGRLGTGCLLFRLFDAR